jgi:non-specific serine/threonine protein kinase
LAIELAAARIGLLRVEQIVTRLDNRLGFLVGGRTAPPRHQTLRALIDWSYDLLSTSAQILLRQLSVFAGGFTLEAAENICDQENAGDTLESLTELVNKSLVVADRAQGRETRYSLHETIRQYALERLRAAGELPKIHGQHLFFFMTLAEKADSAIHGPDQIEWINRVQTDLDNFRAALQWCVAEDKTSAALRLLNALTWPWALRGASSEVRAWLNTVRAIPEAKAHPLLYARLLNELGREIWLWGDLAQANAVLEESHSIALRAGIEGERIRAAALQILGMVKLSNGEHSAAQSLFAESLELSQRLGNRQESAFNLLHLGRVAKQQGRTDAALSLLEQSLEQYHQSGDLWGIGRSSQGLGELLMEQQKLDAAQPFLEQHLSIDQAIDFKQGIVVALTNLGELCRRQGDFGQAQHHYERGLTISRNYNLRRNIGDINYFLGMIALHWNNHRLAGQHFRAYFPKTLSISKSIAALDLFYGVAASAAGLARPEDSALMSGAALALGDAIEYRPTPFDMAEFDRHVRLAREQLGEATFAEMAARGREMTLDQAIAYAMEEQTLV